MMGHRERLQGGDEHDAFGGWRDVLRKRWAPIKRRFWRRVRRAEKQRPVLSVYPVRPIPPPPPMQICEEPALVKAYCMLSEIREELDECGDEYERLGDVMDRLWFVMTPEEIELMASGPTDGNGRTDAD